MLEDKEKITVQDKEGRQVNITVDVPSDPQPQIILETFEYNKLYGKENKSNDNDEWYIDN